MNSILQGDQDTDRNILEFPPKGIIITNPKGLITFFNTAGQKILNLAPEELERRNIFDIIPEVWKDFQDLLLGVEHEIERRVEWDDRTIIINQIPIIEQDAVIKVLNLLQDVSCIEQIIRERETCRLMIDEMVAIIESSYDGFFITDGEGNIIRVNPSWEVRGIFQNQ
jgi:PAS domain S-box-containing protein